VGKWGIGSTKGAPWLHGFQRFYGQMTMREAWAYYPMYMYDFDAASGDDATLPATTFRFPVPLNVASDGSLSEELCAVNPGPCSHSNDMFRTAALSYVSAHNTTSARPFFLMWGPTAPHVGTYNPGTVQTSPVRRLGDRVGTMTMCRRGHAASIEQHLDTDVGALMAALDSSAKLRNTLLVFTSDNGPHAACADDPGYSPAFFVSAGGLRGLKMTMWEGGLRVPTIFFWPGKVPANQVMLTPHALYDLGTTFLELAGVPNWGTNATGPLGAPGGAMSLVPQLLDPTTPLQRSWLHFELCNDNLPLEWYVACARWRLTRWPWARPARAPPLT